MKRLLVPAAALAAISSPSLAQDSGNTRVRVGLGAQVKPRFVGADKSEVLPLFDLDIAKGTNEFAFEAPDYSFGIPVISSGGFSFGPALNLASKRKESDVGAPVGKVKTTIEAGAFANYEVSKSFYLRAEALKGLGGHKGVEGTFGADYVWRDGDKYVVSIGPRVLFSDSRYQRAYFGVTPEAALASMGSPPPPASHTSSVRAGVCSVTGARNDWLAMPRTRR